MIGYGLVLLVLPLLAGLGGSCQVEPAVSQVNSAVCTAAQAASAYEPIWVADVRNALGRSNDYSVDVIDAVHEAARETGVAPELIWAVAYTESKGFHTNATGKVKRGSSGEIGMMQVKPFWSRALKKKYGVELDLYEVKDNIMAGALILKNGGDDTKVALSYYNTGQRLKSSAYQRKVSNYLATLAPAISQR
jgi:soluble lytic murein transglycosylase-like protein